MYRNRFILSIVLLLLYPIAARAQSVYCSTTLKSGAYESSNRGLEYAYYDKNPFYNPVRKDYTNGYPGYDPTYWDTQIPIYVGQTTYLGFETTQDYSGTYKFYPDSPGHTVVNTTLVHRGYVYARTSGTYVFKNTYIDDIVMTWTGSKAYSTFTKSNYDLIDTYSESPQATHTFSITLTAGQYLPIRIQFSNAEQAASLGYSIVNPAGTVILSNTASTDIVTQPCDKSAQFPPFYVGNYFTTTVTQVGTASHLSRTTIKTASGSTTGTVEVITYIPQSTATGNPSCAIATPTAVSDSSTNDNSGLEYGYWNSTTTNDNPDDQVNGYSNYPVSSFDNKHACHIGITHKCGYSTGSSLSVGRIYDDTPKVFNSQFFTLIQRGYLYAKTSGTYTFTIPSGINDIALVWFGDHAISGFNRTNCQLYSTASSSPTSITHNVTFVAGQYIPVRIQYGNAQGSASLALTVTNPNGDTLLSTTKCDSFYHTPCGGETSNGAQIPPFEPWTANDTAYVTTTIANTGPGTGTSTTTIANPSGSRLGTVEVLTPGKYITTTVAYVGSTSLSGPSTSTIVQPSGTAPGTVEVFIPQSYVTIQSMNTDTAATGPSTITLASPTGTTPGTVEILTPGKYVTVTSMNSDPAATGLSTITIATASGTNPGTLEVLIPASYVTVTSTGDRYATGTNTTTIASAGLTSPGTVEVIVPSTASGYVTITTLNPDYNNEDVVTTTIAQPSGIHSGTVEVLTPASFVTITTVNPDASNEDISTTTLAQPSGTAPGTVEILTPASFVTITTVNPDGSNTDISTTTLAKPSGTAPGTVEILTPASYTTFTAPYTGSGNITGPITTTLALPSGDTAGTVEVIIPAAYSTITQAYTGTEDISGPLTITLIAPSGANPGVVAVVTPTTTRTKSASQAAYTTFTAPYTGNDTLTQPITTTLALASGNTTGTVEVLIRAVYVTTTQPYTGVGNLPGPITFTGMTPYGAYPGTVVVLTPTTTVTNSSTVSRPTLATMLGPASCMCLPA